MNNGCRVIYYKTAEIPVEIPRMVRRQSIELTAYVVGQMTRLGSFSDRRFRDYSFRNTTEFHHLLIGI